MNVFCDISLGFENLVQKRINPGIVNLFEKDYASLSHWLANSLFALLQSDEDLILSDNFILQFNIVIRPK